MVKVREAFYAAIIKSLLRTKSLLQTFLNIWISPSHVNGEHVESAEVRRKKRVQQFLEVVEKEFRQDVTEEKLLLLSSGLRAQFELSLQENPLCMLPSYNHQLPTGEERGTYLALDVGGSTFRVALIQLLGRKNEGKECSILRIKSIKIGTAVKQLKGVAFFDWMADRIDEILSGQAEGHEMSKVPLSTGLAWSFPIEQTSLRSGLLLGMGKGFLAAHGLLGQDLGDLIEDACRRKGLYIQLNAIVNDSSATLLSKAYHDSTTGFGLILGTGVNAAVLLPVHIFSLSKFGVRPAEWHDSAKRVIVNTELSMFGTGILPCTKWDEQLLITHPKPNFQPLEYHVSGAYLGEIVRLVLVDGIETAGLLGGVVPPCLKETYSLDTETVSRIEGDTSPALPTALQVFSSRHPSKHSPTIADLQAIRLIASHVSHRACGIVAAGVHALWQLRNNAEGVAADEYGHTSVAYNGSVMEHYPGFEATCQRRLDGLVEASGGKAGVIELMYAEESSLVGAAVAVASLNE